MTYRAHLTFNIEVTRIRVDESATDSPVLSNDLLAHKEVRILRVLLDKLGQMQPGMANLLVIHTRADLAQSIDLDGLMQALKIEVEKKDSPFYTLGRYTSPADFYRDFLHLSAILLWGNEAPMWVNKQARPVLEEKVLHLVRSLASGGEEPL